MQAVLERPKAGQRKCYAVVKRIFDLCSASALLILISPILLILALAVKLEDGGPAFYIHFRVGMEGKPIGIYKFRSMCVNADSMTDLLTPEQKDILQREFKLDDDPRITRIGNFLRRSSLDELPQLLNIIRGEMSVVGPRPVVESELDYYTPQERERFLSVKPGLTGYWQANARNNARYETHERQDMELYYVDNASFWLDIKILFQSVFAVIRKNGAK